VKRALATTTAGLAVALATPAAFGQGCVPARLMTPAWTMQSDIFMRPGEWSFTVTYRTFHSQQDFRGSQAFHMPSGPDLYANTRVHGLDMSLTYAATPRLSLSVEMPLQYGTRQTYYEHDDGAPHTMRAGGQGDMRVAGTFSLLDSEKHRNGNLAISAGVKLPTGIADATDYSYRSTGKVLRPVDPAIQPGDGSWGLLLGIIASHKLTNRSYAYLQGVYLVNPRQTNHTQSPFGDRPDLTGGDFGYIVNSVPDQYVGRLGVSRSMWRARGIAASLGARIDGVPTYDLLGGSDGYRLPGYTVAVEPGVSITHGRNFFGLSVPVAVRRHGALSVADMRTGNPIGGIVALAPYQLIVTYSRRF